MSPPDRPHIQVWNVHGQASAVFLLRLQFPNCSPLLPAVLFSGLLRPRVWQGFLCIPCTAWWRSFAFCFLPVLTLVHMGQLGWENHLFQETPSSLALFVKWQTLHKRYFKKLACLQGSCERQALSERRKIILIHHSQCALTQEQIPGSNTGLSGCHFGKVTYVLHVLVSSSAKWGLKIVSPL